MPIQSRTKTCPSNVSIKYCAPALSAGATRFTIFMSLWLEDVVGVVGVVGVEGVKSLFLFGVVGVVGVVGVEVFELRLGVLGGLCRFWYIIVELVHTLLKNIHLKHRTFLHIFHLTHINIARALV